MKNILQKMLVLTACALGASGAMAYSKTITSTDSGAQAVFYWSYTGGGAYRTITSAHVKDLKCDGRTPQFRAGPNIAYNGEGGWNNSKGCNTDDYRNTSGDNTMVIKIAGYSKICNSGSSCTKSYAW